MAKITADSVRREYVPIPTNIDKSVVMTATRTPAALVVGLGQAVISAGYVAFSDTGNRRIWDTAKDAVSGFARRKAGEGQEITSDTNVIDRHDYTKLWSLQLGDYFMPLSQTFSLRAKKRLNVSSLVDGIDIIQQTRKEAKTVDCNLRLTLRNNQPNLMIERSRREFSTEIVDLEDNPNLEPTVEEASIAIDNLATFLSELYEDDAVFIIKNKMINETFGIQHVFMSDYQFMPKAGMGTFDFKFSLTEVIYGDDILTFDVKQISGD